MGSAQLAGGGLFPRLWGSALATDLGMSKSSQFSVPETVLSISVPSASLSSTESTDGEFVQESLKLPPEFIFGWSCPGRLAETSNAPLPVWFQLLSCVPTSPLLCCGMSLQGHRDPQSPQCLF